MLSLLLKEEKFHNVSLPDASKDLRWSYHPNDNSDFTIERLPSKNGLILIPDGSNYLIKYLGYHGNQQKVYLKLNYFQSIRVKWGLKQYIIQTKAMKTDILKYIIGGVIGLFFGFVGDNLLNSNHEKTDSGLNEIIVIKNRPNTEASTVVSDSIKVDSLSNID